MTASEFDDLLAIRIDKIRATLSRVESSRLASKASEYASDDRLHNFKANVGGMNLDEPPEMVCWGYLRKHLQSVYDMVCGDKPITGKLIDEKIGDCINYLILMEAIMFEIVTMDIIKRAIEYQESDASETVERDTKDDYIDFGGSD